MGLRKIILGAGMLGLVGISAVAIPKDNPYTQVRAISVCITRAECETPLMEVPELQQAYARIEINQSPGYLSDTEKKLFDLINDQRKEAGSCPLEYDPVLNEAAEIRAGEIVVRGVEGRAPLRDYLTHDSGVNGLGENLCVYDKPPFGTVDDVISTFMNDPDSRSNMLSIDVCRMGVAVINTDKGSYSTVLFSD